jgi:hypothetical protein
MAVVASGEMIAHDDRLGAFVDLPAGECVLVYARASSSIEDVDLVAFDDEGNPIAVDDARDPKPTLLLCPPQPSRAYLMANVAEGEGLVAIGAQALPRDRADEVGRRLGAHGSLGEGPRPADNWPGLDDHLRAHRQALGGSWEEFYRKALTLDARLPTVVSFPIEADQCVDAVMVPSEEIAALEVEVEDEAGRVVARAHDGGNDRTLTVCSPMTFAGSLLIRPHVGKGLAAIVLARTRGSTARDFSTRPEVLWRSTNIPIDAARTERQETLAQAGYGAATLTTVTTITLGRRTIVPFETSPGAGGCTRIDVIGGAPLALVDAKAWSEKGDLLGSSEGVWGTALFACQRAKARLDLEARGRSGPVAVTARAERWHDPAFAVHPLAAGRMLSRATEGTAMMLEGTPVSARALTVAPDTLVSWSETVPPSGCLQVTVGAEGEGTGLELRAFDGATGEEIDRSHAERAASVRACAGERKVPDVRFELRTTGGRLDVVVGERVK